MTANLMTLQSLGTLSYHEQDVDHNMIDESSLYGPADGCILHSGYAMPETSSRFDSETNFQWELPLNGHNKRNHDDARQQEIYINHTSKPGADLTVNTPQQNPSVSMFTPTNGPLNTWNVDTVSPLQTSFNHDNFSASPTAHFTPAPRTMHPKRRFKHAEPGSARSIYLEKNRKAASKCRSKQKMQQEELVETARDTERRNRELKAEVEYLQNGMRDLMEIVGQHAQCPDGRLRSYVQREADRLAGYSGQTDQHQQHQNQHRTARQLNRSPSSGQRSPEVP
ncbi:hypothetical protein ACN47E_009732 [Coniothyrium glycines]